MTTKKIERAEVKIESAWEEETRTLRQTIKIYFPPIAVRFKPRASRPGKVHVFTSEEIERACTAMKTNERRQNNAS